jgi:hypothetical protein
MILRTPVVVVAAAALFGGAASLQRVREQRYSRPTTTIDESLYVTSGSTARRLTAGYSAVAADLYWIRAIQYYGGIKLRLAPSRAGAPANGESQGRSDYKLLYPLLDLTTTLDPHFSIAYRFGAIFLAEPYPGGAGRPDLAIALLEKGLRDRPDKWEYMQDIGFVHYWWRHDYKAAAQWFERAASAPGGPWFMRSMAATTLAEGGDRRSSRQLWESIRQSADNDWLRNEAERRLLQLRALDEIDALQAIVDKVTATNRMPPRDWAAAGARGVPPDPSGTPYELVNGRVQVSRQSPLFPLPDEPQRMFAPS